MASGKDKVTRAQVNSLLAEFRKNSPSVGGSKAPAKRGFDARVKGIAGLQGAVTLDESSGKPLTRLRDPKGMQPKDPKTIQYLKQTTKADAESARMGKERKHGKSVFNRVLDVLSRGNYASAEAFRRASNPNDNQKWDFTAGFKGFAAGFTGKKKTTFHQVLKEHGVDGKLGAGLGFVGDVLLDPTTYAGVGLVTKAATKSTVAVKQLNELADVHKSVKAANVPENLLREATATQLAPVKAIKGKHVKNLTPGGKQLYDFAVDAQSGAKSKFVDNVLSGYKQKVPSYTSINLSSLSDETARKVIENTIEAQTKAFPGLEGMIRRVRTESKSGMPKNAPAASNKVEGAIKISTRTGHPNFVQKALDSITAGHTPVKVKDSEELLRFVTIHEIGHHLAYNLPKEARAAIVETIEKAGKVADKDGVRGFLSRNLSDNAAGARTYEEMFADAWAESQIMGNKARQVAVSVSHQLEKHLPKTPTQKEVGEILNKMADDTVVQSGLKGAEAQAVKAQISEELLQVTARNLSGKVKKEFQLKLGPTSVGIPLVAEGAGKALRAVGSVPFIKQSVANWNKAFRASAHIPGSLNFLRQQNVGNSTFLITAHGKELQSIFDAIPAPARKGLLESWREGAITGNTLKGGLDLQAQPVDDVMAYFVKEIKNLDATRMDSKISRKEINSFLGNKHAIMVPDKISTKTRWVNKTDSNGRKYREKVEEAGSPIPFIDMFEQALKANHTIKDPAQALFLYSAALNQAIAKRKMWDTIANTHGVPVGDLSKPLTSKHGWREVKDINPATDGFVFPEEVAVGIERINEVFRDSRSTGMLIDQYDRALMGFKSVVTRYNPSFHTRTFLGEMLLGYMGGMKNLPKSYALTNKVIRGRNQHFLGQAGEEFGATADKKLIQASNALRGASVMDAGVIDGSKTVFTHPRFGAMSADKIWHLYLEAGLKSGFASTDLARGVDAPMLNKTVKVGQAMQSLTEGVEDYGRLAHFIDVLMHTPIKNLDDAVMDAAQTVRKFHLDYTNVTKFEKNVMTRAAPFYKWIRLSTPVMAEILLTQPGKALMVPKTMRAISEAAGYDTSQFGAFPGGPDAAVPEFLRDHGAMPWGNVAGNTNYFDPTALFPLAGSAETAEDPLRAASPFFKWGADLYHGKDKMNNKLTGEGATAESRTHYAAAQTPQTNMLEQLITKRDPGIPRAQTILQFLGNPGNQPNTEKRMRGEAFRQQQEAYSHRKKLREEKGIKPK